jgi:hypothetical protein
MPTLPLKIKAVDILNETLTGKSAAQNGRGGK